MATIGEPLTSPEAGWKRYDDRNLPMSFVGGSPALTSTTGAYSNTETYYSDATGKKMQFDFIGTKVRIIATLSNQKSSNMKIVLDGVEYPYTQYNATTVLQGLSFEKTGLPFGRHTVSIEGYSTGHMGVDAVDIDEDGRVLHPREVMDIKDLNIGKRIRFNYSAPSGAFGFLGGLGEETSPLIPYNTIPAAPNGDAYFVMVGTDRKGNMILVPDRNIQSTVSWDYLLSVGIASTSGLPIRIGRRINPIMTGTSQPYGTAYASSYYSSNLPWRAFDGVTTTDVGRWASNTTDGTGWLAYQFPEPKVVTAYRITGHYSSSWTSQNPRDFTFEGSNDGVQWDILDQQTGVTWSTGAEQKLFFIDNKTPYLHYRVNITSIGNNTYRATIGELDLLEPLTTGPYRTTLRLLTGGVDASDQDNEWDKYIVNSTLDGTITAGDDSVWHWSTAWTLTSTVNSTSSNRRTIRGRSSANALSYTSSNDTTGGNTGFRPVLIIEELGLGFVGGLSPTYIKLDDVTISGNVVNPLGSLVRYRVLLNGVEVLPFTSFVVPPLPVSYVMQNSMFSFGNNQVSIEMETADGKLSSVTYTIYKDYISKYLVKVGSEYKVYDNITGTWKTVGSSVTEPLFLQQGMDDLSLLVERTTDVLLVSDAGSQLGAGKVFKVTVDKSGKSITGMVVK